MKTLFSAATAYRMIEPGALLDLSALNDRPVEECGPQQLSRHGWENPCDKDSEKAVYNITDPAHPERPAFTIICMVTVQKVIKAAAIQREVAKKVKAIEKEEARGVGTKERMGIKEDIVLAALPSAMSEEKRIYAYIDWEANILVIDQHSANRCDVFTKALREAIGSLPIAPLHAAKMPDLVMKSWVADNASPPDIELQGDAVFKSPTDLSQTARVSHVGMEGAGVAGLLEDGMIPQEVSLRWHVTETSSLDFKVSDTVTLKSIKFSDELIDDLNDYEDAKQAFAASMMINCSTITVAIQHCFELFGGYGE